MGLDRLVLLPPPNAIIIENKSYFTQLSYSSLKDDDQTKYGGIYLNNQMSDFLPEGLIKPHLNKSNGYGEFKFSSKNILAEEYPNEGLHEENYHLVIKQLNEKSKGIYRIEPNLFLKSKISIAEVFLDFP